MADCRQHSLMEIPVNKASDACPLHACKASRRHHYAVVLQTHRGRRHPALFSPLFPQGSTSVLKDIRVYLDHTWKAFFNTICSLGHSSILCRWVWIFGGTLKAKDPGILILNTIFTGGQQLCQ